MRAWPLALVEPLRREVGVGALTSMHRKGAGACGAGTREAAQREAHRVLEAASPLEQRGRGAARPAMVGVRGADVWRRSGRAASRCPLRQRLWGVRSPAGSRNQAAPREAAASLCPAASRPQHHRLSSLAHSSFARGRVWEPHCACRDCLAGSQLSAQFFCSVLLPRTHSAHCCF